MSFTLSFTLCWKCHLETWFENLYVKRSKYFFALLRGLTHEYRTYWNGEQAGTSNGLVQNASNSWNIGGYCVCSIIYQENMSLPIVTITKSSILDVGKVSKIQLCLYMFWVKNHNNFQWKWSSSRTSKTFADHSKISRRKLLK